MAGEALAALTADKHDSDELRAKWQELEDQLLYLKDSADVPNDEGVAGLKKEDRQGGQVRNDLQGEREDTAAALERLKGRKDAFAPADETLKNDEEKASDWDLQRLKNEVRSLELQAKRNEDPDKAGELEAELQQARTRLRAKGSAMYRRMYTNYMALFGVHE